MAKFTTVSEPPASLEKGEVVIDKPTFVEECKLALGQAGAKRNTTTLNQLRSVLNAIENKYNIDLKTAKIPLSQYEGLPYETAEDYNKVITRLLKIERPDAFEDILGYNILRLPYGTKMIYFVGEHYETDPFYKNGIERIELKDVDEYLGKKPKRTAKTTSKELPSE